MSVTRRAQKWMRLEYRGGGSDAPPTRGSAGGMRGLLRSVVGSAASEADTKARRSVMLGTLGIIALNVGTVALNFALSLVLARTLGSSGFGAYAFAFGWAVFLSVPASLGISPLVVRCVSSYAEREEWGLLRGVIRRTNQVVLGASAVVVMVAAVVGLVLRDSRPELVGPFLVSLPLVPLIALTGLRRSAMSGLHHVVLGRLPDTVVLTAVFLVLAGAAGVILGDGFTAEWAVALNVVAGIVAFGLGAFLLRRTLPAQVRRAAPQYEDREWARGGVSLFAVGLLFVLNGQIGTILLGTLDSANAVGIYNVATRAASFTSFLYLAATYPLFPNVARLWTAGDVVAIQRLLTRTGRIVSLFSVCVALGFVLFGDTLLGIFGGDFTEGVTALRILVAAEVVKAVTGFGGLALMMTSHEGSMARGTALGVALNVVLAAVLIPLWGVNGAAAASAFGAVAGSVYVAWLTWRRLGIYAPAIGAFGLRSRGRRPA